MYYDCKRIINNIRYQVAGLRRIFIAFFSVGWIELYMSIHSDTESDDCFTLDCLTRINSIGTTPVKWEEINDALSAIDNVIIYYMLKCYDK